MKKIPFSQFGRELFPSHTLLALSGPGTKKVKMKDILSDSTGTGHPRETFVADSLFIARENGA